MLNKVDFYCFSPTGGTRKAGSILADALAEQVNFIDLCNHEPVQEGDCATAVIAMPVFAGRLPAVAAEKIKALKGSGKTVVTMVVYGVRAYEDALLELNDAAEKAGFQVVASAAVIAQHSIVPAVGVGRPDERDAAEITAFAAKVLKKLENGGGVVQVPGNRPYRDGMNLPASPVSLESCIACGACEKVCPVSAVKVEQAGVVTDVQACILCMACTAACPVKARVLPVPLQENMNQKMSALIDVRKENEFYL